MNPESASHCPAVTRQSGTASGSCVTESDVISTLIEAPLFC